MAYRGHKRCDIDGQSDIASLILPPLSLTHTHFCVPLTPPSPSLFSCFLISALIRSFYLCFLSFLFCFFIIPHLLVYRHVLMGSYVVSFICFLTVLRPVALTCSASAFNSAAAFSVLVCTHQHAPKCADSYNHFRRSNNHYFVWRTQGKDVSQQTEKYSH